METRITTKMVEVSTEEYVSFDGRVFTDKETCERYEYNYKLEESFDKTQNIPEIQGSRVSELECDFEPEIMYYRVSNEEELTALKFRIFGEQLEDAAAADFFPKKYPCWIRAEVMCDGLGIFSDAEDFLASLNAWSKNLSAMLTSETAEEYYGKKEK